MNSEEGDNHLYCQNLKLKKSDSHNKSQIPFEQISHQDRSPSSVNILKNTEDDSSLFLTNESNGEESSPPEESSEEVSSKTFKAEIFSDDFSEEQFFELSNTKRASAIISIEKKIELAYLLFEQMETDKTNGLYVDQEQLDFLKSDLEAKNKKLN